MRPPQRLLLAAIVLTLATANAACSTSGNSEVIVGGKIADPELAPTPQIGNTEEVSPTQAPVAEPALPPTGSQYGSELDWTEVDLTDALGTDEHTAIRLESVGDGRVLALSYNDRGIDTVLVTEDSTEWTSIPVPDGFVPWSVDITGDRWLFQGRDSTLEVSGTQILFSDDRGANWTELAVDLGPFKGTAWIVDAVVVEKLIVVVVQSDTWQPHMDETLDDEMDYEPSEVSVHLFLSDGGPAELVAEFQGWASGGHGASDGFHLLLSDSGEDYLLHSPDGRQWESSIVDVEVTDSARNEIWTADQTDGKFKVEHFEGVYGTDQVLTLPEGIGWMPDLAVGPAGVAAVGGPESPLGEPDGNFTLPDMSFEKDGFELRYNQPEGGITLWDLSEDSAVYVFDTETLRQEEPPEAVHEVEVDDGSTLVVFLDPETGAELVAFSGEELAEAVMEAAIKQGESATNSEYNPNEFLVGWSPDGTEWKWQTLQEAFGLPEPTQDENSFTEVEVAVGHDFVIAKVQTFVFQEADLGEGTQIGVGDGQADSTSSHYLTSSTSPSPPRWFIARVG